MKKHALCRILVLVVGLAFVPQVASAQVLEDVKDGDSAFDRGDWRKAAAAYDRAIKKYPKRVAPGAYAKRAAVWLILASEAKKKDDPEVRKKLLEEGLKFVTQKAEVAHPGASEVLEQKALILWALRSKPDAVKVGEKVVASRPEAFAVQQILGEFYAVREPAKAVSALEAYLQHRPKELEKNDVLPRIYLGFALLNVAKRNRRTDPDRVEDLTKRAIEQFEVLLQQHRKRAHAAVNANNGLCAAYTLMGEYDKAMYNRAITVCEQIIQNPRHIDRAGSVFFNLGQAYLENRQPRKARTVGREYVRLRKSEAKGYILVGDAFAQERNWTAALEQYQKAEELAKNSSEYAADIGRKLGISYRQTKQLDLAIAKLEAALEVDSKNPDLIRELGAAYIAAGRDKDALGRAEVLMKAEDFGELKDFEQAEVYVLAGKAAYNLANLKAKSSNKWEGKPEQARAHFDNAYKVRPKDVQVQMGLVYTINLQAYREFTGGDAKQAAKFLDEALTINGRAPLTNQNLAVLAIDKNQCDTARKHLRNLAKQRSYRLAYHRLMARTYLCGKGDAKRAADHFARAEKAASNDNLVRAEIYTEWAPLVWDKDLDKAVEMLESAVQYTAQHAELAKPAQRNLALALFRRGWRTMRKGGNKGQAADDFARASRNPALLKGDEAEAFEFSEALALLEKGDHGSASKLFDKLAKGKQSYLQAPYNNVGAQFFGAYADYRSNSAASQRKAISEFAKLSRGAKGKFAASLRELQAAAYHELAADAYRRGQTKQALSSLNTASRLASGSDKRAIDHNEAVVRMGSGYNKGVASTFDSMGTSPPEALANLGVMLDRQGNPRGAYDAWVKARSKGVRSRSLNDWINAKKRIFGY